jgi:hypothetical protein
MLKQNQVEEKGLRTFRDCFSVVPNLEILDFESPQTRSVADYRVQLRGDGFEKTVYLQMVTPGTPKNVREAVNHLTRIQNREFETYGVVIAPFISPRSAEMCRQAKIGYIDLSGNFWISFDTLFLSRDNMPNRYPYRAGLSSLYSPKTERVLRVLLTSPNRGWKTVALAQEADISLGMITHIRRRLADEEWAEKLNVGFRLTDPESLLVDWVDHFDFSRNEKSEFITEDPLPEIEGRIARICSDKHIDYALTGISASNRYRAEVSTDNSMFYISKDIPEVAQQAGLVPVSRQGNVTLIEPYDGGVLWQTETHQDMRIATPIQVYLDLHQQGGMGEKAAVSFLAEVIRNRWSTQREK